MCAYGVNNNIIGESVISDHFCTLETYTQKTSNLPIAIVVCGSLFSACKYIQCLVVDLWFLIDVRTVQCTRALCESDNNNQCFKRELLRNLLVDEQFFGDLGFSLRFARCFAILCVRRFVFDFYDDHQRHCKHAGLHADFLPDWMCFMVSWRERRRLWWEIQA